MVPGPLPVPSRDVVQELIRQSEQLESEMASFQGEPPPSQEVLEAGRSRYREWFSSARRRLSGEALNKFVAEDKGGTFSSGIADFLGSPREESPLKTDTGEPLFGQRWQYPFSEIRLRLERQRQLLLDNAIVEDPLLVVLEPLVDAFRRFPEFLRTLNSASASGQMVVSEIQNEKQLQVVLEALLRLLFDDVRPEDYAPSHAGANSRVDFLLPDVGIVVETKMTRASMTAAKLGEELLVDAGRYPKHPDCKAIVAFVYDPDRRLTNVKGIERDLTRPTAGGQQFVCVVVA